MSAMKTLLLVFLLTSSLQAAYAVATEPLRATESMRQLTAGAAVWREPGNSLSLSQLLSSAPTFTPTQLPYNGGYSRDAHWFRLKLSRMANTRPGWLLFVTPANLDDIRLFSPQQAANGKIVYREQRAGDRFPSALRPQDKAYGSYSFNLNLSDEQPRVFYLRVQTTGLANVILRLVTPAAQAEATAKQNLWLGITTGIIVMVAVHAFMMWYWLRRSWYWWFIAYALGCAMVSLGLDGAVARYWLTDRPMLADSIISVGACMMSGGISIFFIVFFHMRRNFPRLYWAYITATSLALVGLLSIPFDDYVYVAPWLFGYMLALMPSYLYIRLQTDGTNAIAWACLVNIVCTGISLLAINNIIPAYMESRFGSQVAQIVYLLFFQQDLYRQVRSVEQSQREAELRAQVAERLAAGEKQRRQEQATFLNVVAHELKTPLSVIDSAVQTLETQHLPANNLITSRHNRIRQAVADLNALLENALSAERYENEPLQPRWTSIDLTHFIETLVSHTLPESRSCRLDLSSASLCMADRTLLHLALSNLLVNAVKYSPVDSDIDVIATPHLQAEVPGVLFCIRNQYRHRDKPDVDIWFRKYYRQLEQPCIEGLGLGLYIVREIARTHGGRIDCRVEPLKQFWQVSMQLWLPQDNDEYSL